MSHNGMVSILLMAWCVVMHVILWHYTNVCTLLHGNGTTYTNYGMHGTNGHIIWHGSMSHYSIVPICHTMA